MVIEKRKEIVITVAVPKHKHMIKKEKVELLAEKAVEKALDGVKADDSTKRKLMSIYIDGVIFGLSYAKERLTDF